MNVRHLLDPSLLAVLLLSACSGQAEELGGADATMPDAGAGLDAQIAQDLGPADAGSASPDAEVADVGALPREVMIGGNRPAALIVPESYDGSPTPLVVGLHGYTSSGSALGLYFGLPQRVDVRGFFFVSPDGTREPAGARNRFWNATDACCNFTGSSVDDSGYLLGLINEASARFNIDPKRVFVVGHSNGGFMSYRLACDAAERIAAIVSLAGATFVDPMDCEASAPVSVLQIHGTEDTVIRYQGGNIFRDTYPGSEATVAWWADRAGCTGDPELSGRLDLDRGLPAEDTDVLTYRTGCESGVNVELWRINRGSHVPAFNADYGDRILDFLFAHPKP